jgi:hypothetical protein
MIVKVVVLILCLAAAVQPVFAGDGDLKKTVGIIDFDNNTFYKDADVIAATLTNYVMENQEETCPELILQKIKKPVEVDNQGIAFSGRPLGANAVIMGTLTDIRGSKEDLGFWFFEELVYYAEVHILISIYDTETATKLFMASFEDEIAIDETQFESLESKSASGNLPDLEEPLKRIAEAISEEVCDALEKEPFKTYISRFDVNTVTLVSGGNAGLTEGARLTICGAQERIRGNSGEAFYFSGSETGKLEIRSVSAESSEGRILSGYVDAVDTCVKEKKAQCWLWSIW